MKRISYYTLLINIFISTLNLYAQDPNEQNEKAKEVLSIVSEHYKKNKTSKINFTIKIKSQDLNETQNGNATISANKFHYKTNEREVICNGEAVWTYLFEDDECYIDLLEDMDNAINPNEIFTIWEKGFKYQYINEEVDNNQIIHHIKMFPEKADKSKYHTVIIDINETSKSLQSAIIKTKDGITINFIVNEITSNPIIKESLFQWDNKKYPNVEIIDNR